MYCKENFMGATALPVDVTPYWGLMSEPWTLSADKGNLICNKSWVTAILGTVPSSLYWLRSTLHTLQFCLGVWALYHASQLLNRTKQHRAKYCTFQNNMVHAELASNREGEGMGDRQETTASPISSAVFSCPNAFTNSPDGFTK